MADDDDPDPGLISSVRDAEAAAMKIEGVAAAYVLTGKGGFVITAIVPERELEEVRAELEERFREDVPIMLAWTLEVLRGKS